jgi:hypothetical protein
VPTLFAHFCFRPVLARLVKSFAELIPFGESHPSLGSDPLHNALFVIELVDCLLEL